MTGEVVISRDDFKALSSKTRTDIIKLLEERPHNLSEISKKLSLSGPTIKQHLEILQKATLIEIFDDKRKWKYYSLSKKGKNIFLEQPSAPMIILLGITTIAMVVLLLSMMSLTQEAVSLKQPSLYDSTKLTSAPEAEDGKVLQGTEPPMPATGASSNIQEQPKERENMQRAEEAIIKQIEEQKKAEEGLNLLLVALIVVAVMEGFLIAKTFAD